MKEIVDRGSNVVSPAGVQHCNWEDEKRVFFKGSPQSQLNMCPEGVLEIRLPGASSHSPNPRGCQLHILASWSAMLAGRRGKPLKPGQPPREEEAPPQPKDGHSEVEGRLEVEKKHKTRHGMSSHSVGAWLVNTPVRVAGTRGGRDGVFVDNHTRRNRWKKTKLTSLGDEYCHWKQGSVLRSHLVGLF